MSIRYFIPDWDDRVDPNFDFLHDTHHPGRNPYRDDHYAHEIYGEPPYDGVLLSRAVLDAHVSKQQAIVSAGSVHKYLRLPDQYKVLGDCGAFSYWEEAEPPYSTEQMVDYYSKLKFDYGVSVDHLIFSHDDTERRRRQELTLDNAADFIKKHNKEYSFIPIGVAQGWDPKSYRHSVEKLLLMQYDYIALGGLVRSQTTDIVNILEAVKPVLKPHTQVHLFGVNRPEYVATFARLGVTSFDSASRLRRAWMDGRRNYFLGNSAYSAIRIPEARALAKKKKLDEALALRREREALDTLRAYARGNCPLEDALAAAIAYAELAGEVKQRTWRDYRETLALRPWDYCPCAICEAIGVEVVIFRGNNRNRRRGFHNTWQLYRQLRGEPQELPPPLPDETGGSAQLVLIP